MKWIKRGLLLLLLAAVIALSVLVGMGYQKYREAIEEVPLQQKVEELT